MKVRPGGWIMSEDYLPKIGKNGYQPGFSGLIFPKLNVKYP